MTRPESLIAKLRESLGEDLGLEHTSRYAVDGRAPWAVAFPRRVEQVAEVVRLAAEAGASLVPVGHLTHLGMGGPPRSADVVLSLARLDRVVEQDVDNLTVTVEAGLTLAALAATTAPHRQFLPLDPPLGDTATVGGVLATNASGPRRLLYGSARDLVLGLRVVQADGQVVRTGGKVVKNVTGYDLNKLYIGSLGTLGVIVEATFRLWPQPEAERAVVASFSDPEAVAKLGGRLLDSELIPSAFEWLNPSAATSLFSLLSLDSYGARCGLVIGAEGFAAAVDRQVNQVVGLCESAGAREVRRVEGADLARVRQVLSDLLRPPAGSGEMTAGKASVPISRVAEAYRILEEAGESEGLGVAAQAGLGTGLVRAVFTSQTAAPDRLARAILRAREGVLATGGSLILESGTPELKERVDAWGPPGSAFRLFRSVKQQLDPASLFSPGRFVGGL